jgi:hypothetical protein
MEHFDLVPKISVGPFVIGTSINDYLSMPLCEIVNEFDDGVDWKGFDLIGSGIRIYFENEILISVSCDEECYYNGLNLIGMDYQEFKSIVQAEPVGFSEEDLDDGIRLIYDYDSLELLVYVKDGQVILISCSGPFNE